MSSRAPKKRAVKSKSVNPVQTQDMENGFWANVRLQLNAEWREDDMVKILSPRQQRKFELALIGVKKFGHILKSMGEGYIYYPLSRAAFEKNLHEWDMFGLLMIKGLEEEYLKKVRPSWRKENLIWSEIIEELKALAEREELSEQFFKLWTLYMRRSSVVAFIEEIRPFDVTIQSLEANTTRIVEKYIYSLWMHHNGYKGGRGRGNLESRLLKIVQDKIDEQSTSIHRKRYYTNLITGGLTKTYTDMTPVEIAAYIEDGFFTKADFPELFSPT